MKSGARARFPAQGRAWPQRAPPGSGRAGLQTAALGWPAAREPDASAGPAVGAVAARGHNGIISGQPRLQKRAALPVLASRHKLSEFSGPAATGRSPPERCRTV